MKFVVSLIVGLFVSAATLFAGENVNFLSRPLTAGKASLTENGFLVSRTLGTANFSPELRLPVQLVYESASDKSGIFGYAWKSPQLESSAVPERDGVLWTTPWGEKIKFFLKQKPDKDAVKVELYEQEMKNADFFAPYSEWKADTSAPKGKFTESGNWVFTGKRDYTGWKFTYRDAKLQRVDAPSGRSVQFTYASGKLVKISQNDQAFVEIAYDASSCARLSASTASNTKFPMPPAMSPSSRKPRWANFRPWSNPALPRSAPAVSIRRNTHMIPTAT